MNDFERVLSPHAVIALVFNECITPGYPIGADWIEALGKSRNWVHNLRLIKAEMIQKCQTRRGEGLHEKLRNPQAIDRWMASHERHLRSHLAGTPHYRHCSAAVRSVERALTKQGLMHKDCVPLICAYIWDTRFDDAWDLNAENGL